MGCEKKNVTSSLWYVGVILSIAGSIMTNMGVNMQKYSFMIEAKRCVNMKRGYFCQPLWVLGLGLVVGGSGLDFVALGFLPQSLATPVGGSAMVANVVFASLFLKEKFSRTDAMGTTLVLAGICIVAAFAEKESGCYTVNQLVSLYQEPLFVMYCVLMGVSCIGLYALAKKLEQLLHGFGSSSPKYKRFARGKDVVVEKTSPTTKAILALPKSTSFKLSKASVIPVDSRHHKLSECPIAKLECSTREAADGSIKPTKRDSFINTSTFIDANSAEIEFTQKKFDK
ncbi:Magnesium transporter nipa2, partial [Globisporangium splendens]